MGHVSHESGYKSVSGFSPKFGIWVRVNVVFSFFMVQMSHKSGYKSVSSFFPKFGLRIGTGVRVTVVFSGVKYFVS